MKASELHDAIGQLPESMLTPVEKLRQKKRHPWVKWTAVAAACLCLLLCIPQLFPMMKSAMERNDAAMAPMAGNMDGAMYDKAEEESNMMADSASGTVRVFRAKVLQVLGNGVLVQPLEGEWELTSADQIMVPLAHLEQFPPILVGEIVEITYSGTLMESYPAQAHGVTAIKVIE